MQCPGQDSRYWDGKAIFEAKCGRCGQHIEFFKDDSSRTCRTCGYRMPNPNNDFGCAAYCPYAEQCLGSMPKELLARKQELLKDRVAVEVKQYFGQDFRRIGHAGRVARYAEEIGRTEPGNPAVTLISAYLHDIGIRESERKYQSSAPKYQHQEGPPVAREILAKLGAAPELIEEVCDIIGHHHLPRQEETSNFKVLYDADLITNLEEKQKEQPSSREHLEKIIAASFLTESGRNVCRRVLLNQSR